MAKARSKTPHARPAREIGRVTVGRKSRADLVDAVRHFLRGKYGPVVGRARGRTVVFFRKAGHRDARSAPVTAPDVREPESAVAGTSTTGGPARDVSDAVARTREAYRALVESSLTVAQTARRLAVDPSRVRQRLGAAGDLYGFRSGREWRLLAVFFEPDGGLVPDVGRVARALPAGLTPLEVDAWLRRPHPDLYIAEFPDRDLSPVEWLSMGRDSETVLRLAADVGVS
jgi:hypothetical protein